VFSAEGPSVRELARQALSSVEGGYNLLAPKFDHTPFRTPGGVLDAVAGALRPFGPFGPGLDVCCGTGAGMRVLTSLCQGPVTGVDFSTGMLEQARNAYPDATWVRADARALPFTGAFDLAVSFGALGHFLPAERPALFAGVHRALRPAGVFAFPVAAPQHVTSRGYWALLGFDLAMRVRNALWRPPFVMYYRTCPLQAVRDDLAASGFTVTTLALTALGRRDDGSPRYRLVLARKAAARPSGPMCGHAGLDAVAPARHLPDRNRLGAQMGRRGDGTASGRSPDRPACLASHLGAAACSCGRAGAPPGAGASAVGPGEPVQLDEPRHRRHLTHHHLVTSGSISSISQCPSSPSDGKPVTERGLSLRARAKVGLIWAVRTRRGGSCSRGPLVTGLCAPGGRGGLVGRWC
jgi:SAM-dependent methyltransferase